MGVAVVNSGGANISSVIHALHRLGAEPRFTEDADIISKAERVILPGVGAAGRAMEVLRSHGLIPARLERLPEKEGLRVPHMGWNAISNQRPDPLTDELNGKWFYFVHSYAAPVGDWTLSSSTHGAAFSAIVRRNNFYGAQFHPERSAQGGAQLLRSFLEPSLP